MINLHRFLASAALPVVCCASIGLLATSCPSQESYPRHADAKTQADVPKGMVTSHRFEKSKVFPGTQRDYFVYVPAQYSADKPAALMVFQDGAKYVREKGEWQLPTVFDNLIHRGEMPPTIALCINPGVVTGSDEGADDAQHRFNRSYEYDTVSDRYAQFIVDEMIPELKKSYSITDDPNLRAIGGSSSGAIAAFGVAWHRPDQFRRVFSTVGTFVGLRGGNEYPTMIRKAEPKPLRVFLQDGRNDLDIYGGSWWHANTSMLSALQWAGYQVKNEWGDGGHNGKHGAAVFPDAMKWLWANHDRPITTDTAEHPELKNRLLPDEGWQLVSDGHKYTEGPAIAPDGGVYFVDGPRGEIWKVNSEDTRVSKEKLGASKYADMPGVSALMFDSQGRLYCARNKAKKLTRIEADGTQTDLMTGKSCNDLVVLDHGIYFSGPDEKAVWYLRLNSDAKTGEVVKAGAGPEKPNGLIVTPDKRFLLVVDALGHYIWSYRIGTAGKLHYGQPYSYVHQPKDELNTGGDGCTMTTSGELLVATKLGVQIFDQPGRAHIFLKRPKRTGRLSNLVFAGDDMQTLYATSGTSVFRRKTKMTGIAPWQDPVKPPKPRL